MTCLPATPTPALAAIAKAALTAALATACAAPATDAPTWASDVAHDAADGTLATASDGTADRGAAGASPRYAIAVVSFAPGPYAGFGADKLPGVVLGPPHGGGGSAGSLDVVSLGQGGEIVVELANGGGGDGPGIDLVVFENPFGGWIETGRVAVSEDGATWSEFPCAAEDKAGGYPGCAGVQAVHAGPAAPLDPARPALAGGDGFDLATIGVHRVRYVRIRDTGLNPYAGVSGGFDLDAVAALHP